MQSGSRHCRQEVATRYLSNRRPSRTRRLTPWWASAQARTHLIAAGAALQIEHEKALRLHQPLREELVDGQRSAAWTCARRFSSIRSPAIASRRCANLRKTVEHELEVFARNPHDLDVVESRAGSGSRSAAQERDFAEVSASGQIGQNQFASGTLF